MQICRDLEPYTNEECCIVAVVVVDCCLVVVVVDGVWTTVTADEFDDGGGMRGAGRRVHRRVKADIGAKKNQSSVTVPVQLSHKLPLHLLTSTERVDHLFHVSRQILIAVRTSSYHLAPSSLVPPVPICRLTASTSG